MIDNGQQQQDDSAAENHHSPSSFNHQLSNADLLKQLQLAKKLRSRLETAASQVEASQSIVEGSSSLRIAQHRFFQLQSEMLQLVSLTEAVSGGYALDSYDQYSKLFLENEMASAEDLHKAISEYVATSTAVAASTSVNEKNDEKKDT